MPKKTISRGKKDFSKITHKVGQRKSARNETQPNSVSARRVIVPLQKLEWGNIVAEALIGLRHYNDKKRIESINCLMRVGAGSISSESLCDVMRSLGYGISDDEAVVRRKCCTFLCQMLSEFDEITLKPFVGGMLLQLRAGLANVKSPIRVDSITCLREILRIVRISESTEIFQLLKSLIELSSITSRSTELLDCVETLLEHLRDNQDRIDKGLIDSTQWTISAIVERSTACTAPPLVKFLLGLQKNGHDEYYERIKSLATAYGLIASSVSLEPETRAIPIVKKNASAFSRLSVLMNEDSD